MQPDLKTAVKTGKILPEYKILSLSKINLKIYLIVSLDHVLSLRFLFEYFESCKMLAFRVKVTVTSVRLSETSFYIFKIL